MIQIKFKHVFAIVHIGYHVLWESLCLPSFHICDTFIIVK